MIRILVAIGLAFLLLALFSAARTYRLLSQGVRVTGQVIDVVYEAGPDSTTPKQSGRGGTGAYYRPVVQFQRDNGTTIVFKSTVGEKVGTYNVGQMVHVIYPTSGSGNPKILDGKATIWGNAIVLGIFAVLFLIFAAAFTAL